MMNSPSALKLKPLEVGAKFDKPRISRNDQSPKFGPDNGGSPKGVQIVDDLPRISQTNANVNVLRSLQQPYLVLVERRVALCLPLATKRATESGCPNRSWAC